ncbi:SDR family NAD(P)-dependent oxidoreductase [Georhizobium sp. MAB10]|uniref:SDR family NAD(P)-dependent oxidoreductase n=1 Tax=Georhizobium sp. MAB10 TaxID=3028319 RepID=UPI003855ADB1
MRHYFAEPSHGAVWVTGASSGIGAALALKLAQAGYTVVATARGEDKLNELAAKASTAKGRIQPMPGDVTDEADMARIVDSIISQHGKLALAIFNAGVYIPVHGNELKVEDFHKTFAVNLNGVVNGLVPTVNAMQRAGRGHIAIVSSVTGYGGLPTSAAYGATKAALTNMAESLKFDLDKMNIRIQVVHPGFVDTPATEKNEFAMPALMKVDDAVDRIIEGLKRPGFEITFPKRFTYALKFLGLFPYPVYFAAINRMTGWSKRPLESRGSD